MKLNAVDHCTALNVKAALCLWAVSREECPFFPTFPAFGNFRHTISPTSAPTVWIFRHLHYPKILNLSASENL